MILVECLLHLVVVDFTLTSCFSCSRAQTLGWSKLVCGQNALTVSRYSTSPVVSSCCHRWVLPPSLSCSVRGIYAKKTRVYCVKEMTESRVSLVVRFKIRSLCLNINWWHCIQCNDIHCSPCVLFKHSRQCRHKWSTGFYLFKIINIK